ncbi:CDP-glucose 4,6-dehydratase [Aquirufa ecclesiirivi]
MESMVDIQDLSIYRGKKVFVTGHTGFKGSWLCSMLSVLGAEIAGFSLAPSTEPSHFNLLAERSNSTIADIVDANLLHEAILTFRPEIVFHLAAQPLVRESYHNPVNTYQTNVIGTLNLLEAVRNCSSVKSVVIITTDKVYENKEWIYPYRENDQLGGYDMYSSSKACAEILTQSYQRSFFNLNTYPEKHQVLIATARAGNVIGGGDWSKDRLIPDIIRATIKNEKTVIRNPSAIRPWQHVLDCLKGYLILGKALLEGKKEFAEAWNFSPYSFESRTVQEVASISMQVWPSIQFEIEKNISHHHEAGLLKLDNSKAISRLHWTPKWNTKKAIEETINWYKKYYLEGVVMTEHQIAHFLGI